ncbi:solute carrier family 23 protein [Desulfitispora alkaliphila]|uniref:solute carrier family 23 protein n=1 Tax=Desulfitispora alkaliphila TaxID=622674 RepID=UPI003D1A5DA3
MAFLKREDGKEQPYWPAGPFKIRLPVIHYKPEPAEFIQALFMFVVSLSMIPLLQQYLGLPYEVALAFVVICGIGFMLPALLGVPFVPGWITPAIPVVVLYLGQFTPGPEAIRALVALQLIVAVIFLLLGITKLGSTLVNNVPNSLKAGILMGAGIAAIMGEIQTGGRLDATPISLIIGCVLSIYILFSLSFKNLREKSAIARILANYGMVPGIIVAMVIGWIVNEYPVPDIKFGITQPAFTEMWAYLPFSVGFPSLDLFLLAIPTAIIAYIIAFGDIIVGTTLVKKADAIRKDEFVDINSDRVHIVTAIRNFIHAFFAPYPGLAGPIWTAVTATVAERYKYGRKAMDSIYGGAGTFWIAGFIALFILPLVSMFQPILPIGMSLTLIITGYLCISVGIEQVNKSTERGVAGVMAVVLAVKGAAFGLAVGIILYLLVERPSLMKQSKKDNINI